MNYVVIIDGPNLNGAQDAMGWSIDFTRLKAFFQEYEMFYFAYIAPTSPQSLQRFFDYLRGTGYHLIIEEGQDVDQLVINQLIKLAQQQPVKVNEVILFAGDATYAEALELLKSKGVIIKVACVTTMLAAELTNIASEVINLDDLRTTIEDRVKTRKRYGAANNGNATTSSTAELVGSLMASGTKLEVRTTDNKIIIEITLPD